MTETQQAELSERELEILRLVATGASNKEIAFQLSISANTVKVHLRNIFGKIGVASRTEAAMYAVKMGLVSGGAIVEEDASEQQATRTPPTQIDRIDATQKPARLIKPFVWGGGLLGIIAIVLLIVALTNSRGDAIETLIPPTAMVARWQKRAAMTTARSGLAVIAYDGAIFTIAGEAESGVTGVVEKYDPETDRWSTWRSKPVPVADVSAVIIGGKFYVPGGRLISGGMTSILEIYDPDQDIWSTGTPLPRALSAYAIVSYEGKIYLFGGWDGTNYLDKVWVYDPALDVWDERTPMLTPRAYAGAAISGGQIYVICGRNENGSLETNEMYMPAREGRGNPWNQVAPSPLKRSGIGATSIADTIYVVGGNLNVDEYSSSIYVPALDTWQVFQSPFADAWSRVGVTAIGGQLFVMGGEMNGKPISSNFSYQAVYTIVIPIIR